MRFVFLKFVFRAVDTATLPEYKGSMFRGAMGRVLHDIGCKSEGSSCEDCGRRQACIYYHLYAARDDVVESRFRSIRKIPRPYTIRCANEKTRFMPGEYLECDLTVIGRAIDWASVLAVCLARAGVSGFGVQRARFEIESCRLFGVNDMERQIFRNGNLQSVVIEDLEPFQLLPPGDEDEKQVELTLELVTPMKWANGVRASSAIDMKEIVKSSVRRASALSFYWDSDDWRNYPFSDLYNCLEGIRLENDMTRWVGFKRFSMTQPREIPVEGRVGKMIFSNVPVRIARFMKAFEYIHIGKGATIGQGQIRLNMIDRSATFCANL